MEWVITSAEAGQKLISFLFQRLDEKYSARFLKRQIEQNKCTINGRPQRFASTLLGRGDIVQFNIETQVLPSTKKIEKDRILYEDKTLLVYNKPPGINCEEKGILKILQEYDTKLKLVHRLDRDTTGALILAKGEEIFENLVSQFKDFQVAKKYLAIVDKLMNEPCGVIENYLGKKHAFAGQTLWGAVEPSKGLSALTEWICLKQGKNASYIACYPKTGRTHQIRVHLAGIGHPILGDHQYGKEFECTYRAPRYLLHAEEIQFLHPLTKKTLKFTASLPDDFSSAIQMLFKG